MGIIDRHLDLNAGERVSTIEPLIGSGKAKSEVEVAAPALKQMVVTEPAVSDCIQGTPEDFNPPQLEVAMVVEPLIGSGKAKPEVEVAAPVLKQMVVADAVYASSSKAPDEAGWVRGSAVAESANNWFKGQSEGTLDDQPSNEQHMRVSEELPEVQLNVEAEAALVRQVHQVKARLAAATQHKETQHMKESAELQTARAKEQQLHTQRWCRVNCCGAAKFGDMPQYFIDCSDCPCKRQNKPNKFT